MKTFEIRNNFIDFFKNKGHKYYESAPLVPNDPNILFTIAGMVPFKQFFLGNKSLSDKRAVSCQRCIRTNDIDNIGLTKRHLTFFEMLGNFSFGDYFKEECIKLAFEFITEILKISKDKLVITVYEEDQESFEIWKSIGIENIKLLGKRYNFWESGNTGPCGPCSEIYYCYKDPKDFDPDSEDYLEFWNLVFMQYEKKEDGTFEELRHKSIDTGMGLERIASILQNKDSNFEIDIFYPMIDELEHISNTFYKQDEKSFRVIVDHIRSSTFLIMDGILPSNEKRGYVLRRLIRRACRYGLNLKLNKPFLFSLVDILIETMSKEYPNLENNKNYIKDVIKGEEERFINVLNNGIEYFKSELNKVKNKFLEANISFKLYDTYGFPFELTKELCEENNISLNEEDFQKLLDNHQAISRSSKVWEKLELSNSELLDLYEKNGKTEFLGYNTLEIKARVIGILKNNEIVLDKTVFYAEAGGQIYDTGVLYHDTFSCKVLNVQKIKDIYIHTVEIEKGCLSLNQIVILKVNKDRREAIRRNHSSIHIVHASLKKVLGNNITQAGSFVDEKIGRFDFNCNYSINQNQIDEIESLANIEISKNYEVITHVKNIDEANKMNAVSLFEEKYEDIVRVIEVGDFSLEFCGGTHVSRTGDIGLLKIMSCKSIGANIKRIEIINSFNLENYIRSLENDFKNLGSILKTSDINDKVLKIINENSNLKNDINIFKKKYINILISKFKDEKIIFLNEEIDSKILLDILKANKLEKIYLIKNNEDTIIVSTNPSLSANFLMNECLSKVQGKGGGNSTIAKGNLEIDFLSLKEILLDIIKK